MDVERTYSRPRADSRADKIRLSKAGSLLQYWFLAIPLLLIPIYVAGSTASRFRQIGNDIQLTASSATAFEAAPQMPPTIAPDPWNPVEVLAPYAPVMWGTFAAGLGVVFLVALMRILPAKRYKQVTDAASHFSEPKNVFTKRQHLLRVLTNDVNALFEGRLEVRHVMTRRPVIITPNESLESACELMDSTNVHHLVVCDDDGLLIGMLSRHYARRCTAKTVGKAMLTKPVAVPPGALLNPTVTQMISTGVSCVAVVVEGYCVGILTTADVQLTLQCALTLLFKATNHDTDDESPFDNAPTADNDGAKLDEVLASVEPGEYQPVS